ncbi:MAG: hypothetical protein IAB19_09950 [Proteobacteria bacterium]|uniref:DUF1902 domain-containing protein n=1 Tax=Candidatus Avisuccinivibrio stercorigallinarum TaxID=2840704 RepID=A0A9D9DC42_9GAMM|nr:hypothetical protein [Candidatus Avisuccinivibrio stercorigallinarum]
MDYKVGWPLWRFLCRRLHWRPVLPLFVIVDKEDVPPTYTAYSPDIELICQMPNLTDLDEEIKIFAGEALARELKLKSPPPFRYTLTIRR